MMECIYYYHAIYMYFPAAQMLKKVQWSNLWKLFCWVCTFFYYFCTLQTLEYAYWTNYNDVL